jgi:hypothetical protein
MIPEGKVSVVTQSVVTNPFKSILGYTLILLTASAIVGNPQVFLK